MAFGTRSQRLRLSSPPSATRNWWFACATASTVQSTEFDIVEQGTVPILISLLMPLPQMRNLSFQIELFPDNRKSRDRSSSPEDDPKKTNLHFQRKTKRFLRLLRKEQEFRGKRSSR